MHKKRKTQSLSTVSFCSIISNKANKKTKSYCCNNGKVLNVTDRKKANRNLLKKMHHICMWIF